MPRGIYKNLQCSGEKHPPFLPQKHQTDAVNAFMHSPFKGMLLYHKLGCLAPNTPVLLWNGLVKKAQEINKNDILIGDDGLPRTVLETVSGVDQMYRIEQSQGNSYTVNSEHFLSLQFLDNIKITWDDQKKRWILKRFDMSVTLKNSHYDLLAKCSNNVIDIKVHDYLLLPKNIKSLLKCYKCEKVNWSHSDVKKNPYEIGTQLNIPINYIVNDENTRLEVLAGIIDTIGDVREYSIGINHLDNVLQDQICYIARSLGFLCTQKNTGLTIYGNGLEKIPLKEKQKFLPNEKSLCTSFKVVPVGEGKYFGWKLDGNKRFLLGDFTVTHNSGKTCTAIMIADKMLQEGKVKNVFILSPGSLRSGWLNEYCKMCGESPETIYNKFTFITYNYSVGNNLPDFNNSLVIIDEAHNLINGAKNRSDTATKIYDALQEANCRILALSGTPIYNYIFEFALMGNLLKPGSFPEIRHRGGINSMVFSKFFNEAPDGTLTVRNPQKMSHLLNGIISYYPGSSDKNDVPDVIEQKPIRVKMTPIQEVNYWSKQIQEAKLSKPPVESLRQTDPARYALLERLYIMARKNILTRRASNFFYPEDIEHIPDSIPRDGIGWITRPRFEEGQLYQLYSTKITALLTNLVLHNKQKHLLFTFFKEKGGVQLIHGILSMCNIRSEIFSGDLDDKQRTSLLSRFNSKENNYGERIRILLVTEAGAEGISVLSVRHMHILESSPRISKTIQAIGRVARFRSHQSLPENERSVKIWRYWSEGSADTVTITTKYLTPEGKEEEITKIITDKTTIDRILYEEGAKTIRAINSFLNLLKSESTTAYNEQPKNEIPLIEEY